MKIHRRAILLCPLTLLATPKHNYRFDKQFAVTPKSIDIEIANGTVKVLASSRKEIRVVADIELSAPTTEDLELAKREVRFDPHLDNDSFRIWVETPNDQRRWNRYNTRHNVEVDMPADTRLILRGVNGKIEVSYDQRPTKDIYVKNVNGEIQLEFPKPLNADFQIKTMNGHVYSGFEMTPLPDESETKVTEQGMKRIVSRNRFAGGRVGHGGIEIKVEGLNGDIRIVERKA